MHWYPVLHCTHEAVLHALSSVEGPSQGIFDDEHLLNLFCLPPPQRLLQGVQMPQFPYFPYPVKVYKKGKMSAKN